MAVNMEREAGALRRVLADRGLTHLRVIKRGKALTIRSDSEPEVRLRCLAHGAWQLDFYHHSGRWDVTPFVGDLAEMVDMAEGMGRLEDLGPPGSWRS
jgi:hypothetical protein